MGSYKHTRVFDPLELEIIDRVYEAAWAQLEAREPFRDERRMASGATSSANGFSRSQVTNGSISILSATRCWRGLRHLSNLPSLSAPTTSPILPKPLRDACSPRFN